MHAESNIQCGNVVRKDLGGYTFVCIVMFSWVGIFNTSIEYLVGVGFWLEWRGKCRFAC